MPIGLIKVVADYAVSADDINYVAGRSPVLRWAFGSEHSIEAQVASSTPSWNHGLFASYNPFTGGSAAFITRRVWALPGRHTIKRVPRILLQLGFAMFGGTTPTITAALSNTAYGGLTRNGPGDYFISLPALSEYSLGPITPAAAGSTVRCGFVRHSATPAGLIVALYELSGTTWVRADYGFTVPVWEAP